MVAWLPWPPRERRRREEGKEDRPKIVGKEGIKREATNSAEAFGSRHGMARALTRHALTIEERMTRALSLDALIFCELNACVATATRGPSAWLRESGADRQNQGAAWPLQLAAAAWDKVHAR
ncbi:unnamed protein product [Prorocentrum cordatum]|uniref:Uncharacterized protein n=1 Tax=Prorocentrum cordatum TaxID=2364126 RepID=A0ABN9QH61_9DINO|nr:unnamed protein product [Polarella glacialis]